MPRLNVPQIIDNYKAAYKAANGEDVRVNYHKGYFRIYKKDTIHATPYRSSDIIRFTETLNARVKAATLNPDEI